MNERQMQDSIRSLGVGDLAAFVRHYYAANENDPALCAEMEAGETVRVRSFWTDDLDGQVWVRVTLTGKDEYTVMRSALRFVER